MKNWTETSAGTIKGAEQRLWVALGDNAEEVATRINTDPVFVTNITDYIVFQAGMQDKRMTSLNPQWLCARRIMGKNFFGIEEVIKHFGVNPSKQQLATLAEIRTPKGRLISEEEMHECKDTHVLVAMFPLSILDIRGIAKKQSDRTLFYSQDWYDKQAFAKDKGEVGWQLVRKEPIANSTSKTWNDQQALLSKDEETPTARIVVYTMVGHFLATGERLFEKIYVRCVDLDSDGGRVSVGDFGAKGLYVDDYWSDRPNSDIGLSAARK